MLKLNLKNKARQSLQKRILKYFKWEIFKAFKQKYCRIPETEFLGVLTERRVWLMGKWKDRGWLILK